MPKTALLGMLALMTLPAATGLAAGVAVTRGSGPVPTAGVTVLRGEPSMPRGSGTSEAEPAAPRRAIAGNKVWFVDGDRLVACRMVNTVMVGVRAVECASRRNPVDR